MLVNIYYRYLILILFGIKLSLRMMVNDALTQIALILIVLSF
jgi:hypothetical protein